MEGTIPQKPITTLLAIDVLRRISYYVGVLEDKKGSIYFDPFRQTHYTNPDCVAWQTKLQGSMHVTKSKRIENGYTRVSNLMTVKASFGIRKSKLLFALWWKMAT